MYINLNSPPNGGIIGLLNFSYIINSLLTLFPLHPRNLAPVIDTSSLTMELTKGVQTRPVHSHNTYDNGGMLLALANGCISVEADVWVKTAQSISSSSYQGNTTSMTSPDKDLFIAHTELEIDPNKTLNTMYLDALYILLSQSNTISQDMTSGIFFNFPHQTLYLFIDSKSSAQETWPLIKAQLQRFIDKKWLTYYDNDQERWIHGPLTIVLTGNQPIDGIMSEPIRYFSLDGDLKSFTGSTDETTLKNIAKYSIVASTSMTDILQSIWYQVRSFSPREKTILKSAFSNAATHGVLSRIWGGVTWSSSLASSEDAILHDLGESLLNLDDVTKSDLYITSE